MKDPFLKPMLETIPMPIMVIGGDQSVRATNAPLRQLLGDHIEGRHFTAALRQPVLVATVEDVAQSRQEAQSTLRIDDHGAEAQFDVTLRPWGADVVLSFEDRTEAQGVSRFRSDFVANVSHELRTPLTALLGFIETLRGPARDDAAARDRFLEIMESEAVRMTRLVDDLLSLSRVEVEERVRPRDPVSLGDLARATISEMGPVISDAGVKVALTDEGGSGRVLADSRQIRQVLGNLIENALKYGAPGGQIAVTIGAETYSGGLRGAAMLLEVRDDGPGIPAHHIPRLTERFYRLDDHRNRALGGTGLGLAIVKHIVNRHRGRLTITSTLGEGTTVGVLLPTQVQ